MTHQASATVHGAITAVNAIPCGRGAAIGIELPMRAEVTLQDGPGQVAVTITEDPTEDPTLAREAVAAAARHADVEVHGRVRTTSPIPVARGLKSSSAAANAIVVATLAALEHEADTDTILRLGIEAARAAGVTHTGALDDAAASLLGGVVATDNSQGRILDRRDLGQDLHVLILVPDAKRYTRDAVEPLKRVADACGWAHDRVLEGRWREGLTVNGLACSAALNEPLGPAAAAMAAGADAAGLTGTGPAVAAVCPAGTVHDVRTALERYAGRIIQTRTTNTGPEVGA